MRSASARAGHYNRVHLHSAIGYVTPLDKLHGREPQIFAERDRKLEEAHRQRQLRRHQALRNLSLKPLAMTGESSALGLN